MCVIAGCIARARLVPFAPAWARGAMAVPSWWTVPAVAQWGAGRGICPAEPRLGSAGSPEHIAGAVRL
jgi:hypothetical protein